MKLKRMMPVATAHGGPSAPTVRGPVWKKIENEYGKKLSCEVREKIVAATNDYIYWASLELTAPPSAEYEVLAKSLIKHSEDLLSTLQQLFRGDDATRWLKSKIEAKLDPQGAPERKILQVLLECVDGCSKATQLVLHTIQNSDPFKSGGAWRSWVRAITKALADENLPHQVTKDGLGRSPMVVMMRLLQSKLPKKFRSHYHSDCALANAIALARRPVKRNRAQRKAAA